MTTEQTKERDGAVVLVSGGMDSATAAFEAQERGYELYFLHTTYGQQTADKEFECAHQLAEHMEVADFLNIETDHLARIGSSSLTDDSIDVEQVNLDSDEIPSSYVPFRNSNLLSMATSYAEANECSAVFIGAHSEDYSGYPDCRPEFFDAFQQVINVGTKPETSIELVAPFVDWTKSAIAERGLELDVPYELTWSCYREEAPACGTCDACAYRLKAFQEAGVEDQIGYDDRPEYGD